MRACFFRKAVRIRLSPDSAGEEQSWDPGSGPGVGVSPGRAGRAFREPPAAQSESVAHGGDHGAGLVKWDALRRDDRAHVAPPVLRDVVGAQRDARVFVVLHRRRLDGPRVGRAA